MRRLLCLIVLLALPGLAGAQEFIRYYPGSEFKNYTKTLTAGVATPIFDIAVPAQGVSSALVMFSTICSDGTDFVSTNYLLTILCGNKADTETCAVTGGTHSQSAASSGGTFSTATLGLSYGTNSVTLTFTAVCSLVETKLDAVWRAFPTPDAAVITPR